MSKAKVVICVYGGNIQEIVSSNKNIEVVIIDYDNLEAENKTQEEMTEIFKTATKGLLYNQ